MESTITIEDLLSAYQTLNTMHGAAPAWRRMQRLRDQYAREQGISNKEATRRIAAAWKGLT